MDRGMRILVIAAVSALMLTGCADLKDKFVRKSKKDEQVKQFYTVRQYDVKPSMELYTKRYIFWKTWHKEFLEVLPGGNKKKIAVAVEQEYSNLLDMQNMLADEKAEALQKYVDDLGAIVKTVKTEGITRSNRVQITRRMETLGRDVKRDFSYNKVKGQIRDEFRNQLESVTQEEESVEQGAEN